MSTDNSFAELVRQLRAGDESAASMVFHLFARRLVALARTRLDGRVLQKEDPEDVVQSVFRSFFARTAEEQYHLESWDGLWGLLALITVRKCGRRAAHFRAARRDVGREASPPDAAADARAEWEALAREPTPLEAALLADTLKELLAGLGERDRQIATLSLEGCTIPDISAQVGCTERTVYRVLERLRQFLEAQQDEEDQ
jgi:RNA polymerase sigma-70 factor (ECF subfamily)